jgi:hypothetical protein
LEKPRQAGAEWRCKRRPMGGGGKVREEKEEAKRKNGGLNYGLKR